MEKEQHIFRGKIPGGEYVIIPPKTPGYYDIILHSGLSEEDGQYILAVLFYALNSDEQNSQMNQYLLTRGIRTDVGELEAKVQGRIPEIGLNGKLTGRVIFVSGDEYFGHQQLTNVLTSAGMTVNS
jgi:hypothetical protein